MAGGALCEVVAANGAPIPPGSIVWAEPGWKEYAIVPANRVLPVTVRGPLSHHMSGLGITGLTAYFWMLTGGQARGSETVVVSAGAGAMRSAAGHNSSSQGAGSGGRPGSAARTR